MLKWIEHLPLSREISTWQFSSKTSWLSLQEKLLAWLSNGDVADVGEGWERHTTFYRAELL